jgi:hypothetical protein
MPGVSSADVYGRLSSSAPIGTQLITRLPAELSVVGCV